jgi:hypothetical protein
LQEEPSQGKENVPPSLGQKPTKKQKKTNRCNPLITRGKPTYEALEKAMDEIENGRTSLRKVNRHWNIPLTSLFDHLDGKRRSKKPRPTSMLTLEENKVVVAWVLSMKEVRLSISLQQLKMKVAKLTQTRPTPFQGKVLRTF